MIVRLYGGLLWVLEVVEQIDWLVALWTKPDGLSHGQPLVVDGGQGRVPVGCAASCLGGGGSQIIQAASLGGQGEYELVSHSLGVEAKRVEEFMLMILMPKVCSVTLNLLFPVSHGGRGALSRH